MQKLVFLFRLVALMTSDVDAGAAALFPTDCHVKAGRPVEFAVPVEDR
jgi:hypothetical protein